MPRRRESYALSFSASLVLHGAVCCALIWWYISYMQRTPMAIAKLSPMVEKAPVILPPPPPEPDFSQASAMPEHDDSGEQKGKGTANRSTEGAEPMQAAAGLEQANLTRSKQGDKESLVDGKPPEAVQLAQVDPTPTVGVKQEDGTPVFSAPKNDPKPAPAADLPPLPPGESIVKKRDAASSDTESVPFSKAHSVTFRNGKLAGREGRKVKTTPIRLGLAGETDAMARGGANVQLGVRVEATGFVKSVEILHSSGSDNIDLPCQRAVYNWWFEPKKDADGKPQPDAWVVTIE